MNNEKRGSGCLGMFRVYERSAKTYERFYILSIFGERCTAPCRVENCEAKGRGVDCIAFSHKAGWCNVKLHWFNFLGYASIPRMLRESSVLSGDNDAA